MTSFSTSIPPRCASCGREIPAARSRAAFSLVEVAIALGIVSFVLISLLGLMTAGLDAGKEAREDTAVAGLAFTVLSDLKTNSFATLADTNRYFSQDGRPASAQEAYYACAVRISPPGLPLPGISNNTVRVRLEFTWPKGSPKTNEQVLETAIARY